MNTVELTDEEVKLFKTFREYQEIFELLLENGVFDVSKSTVILSISQPRIITDIDVHQNRYKRRKTDQFNLTT